MTSLKLQLQDRSILPSFHDHCLKLDLHTGFSKVIAHNSYSLSDKNERIQSSGKRN